jgi:hypothetical protein
MFAAPSPKNTNRARLFLDERGQLFDRKTGAFWGRSSIARMAHDAMPPDLHSAVGAGKESDHERREGELKSEMQKLCDEFDLHDEVAAAVMGLVNKHFPVRNIRGPGPNAVRGKGATDKSKNRARDAEEPDFEAFASLLRRKGLSEEDIEAAHALVQGGEATDRLPVPGPEGRGGHLSGRSKDDDEAAFEREYPESRNTTRDIYGAPRGDFDPVREAGERAAARLPGGGISRRLPAGDVALADDETMAREYPGIENVKTTVFG